MAGRIRSRVVVNFSEPWMQAELSAGGTIHDTTRLATREAMEAARMEILTNHTRSGALAKGFRIDMNRKDRRSVFGVVRNTADHADFFFKGTKGPITAGGTWMKLHDAGGTPPGTFTARYRKQVRGQKNKEVILNRAVRQGLRITKEVTRHDLKWRGLL